MKRFAGPMMAGMMRKMGLKDGIPIESPMVSRAVEKAQKRVEEFHYGIRKNLLEYDQVMNTQRTMIYRARNNVLAGKDLEKTLMGYYRDAIDDLIQRCAADGLRGPELATKICDEFTKEVGIPAPPANELPVKEGGDECLKVLYKIVTEGIEKRKMEFGQDVYDTVMRLVLLDTIDRRWKDHLYAMDHLRHAIGLEGYAQKDPRLRYKEEGYKLFLMMNELIRADVAKVFFRLQFQVQPNEGGGPSAEFDAGGFKQAPGLTAPKPPSTRTQKAADSAAMGGEGLPSNPGRPKPSPADPCPCGSGRAFKACHGK